MAFAKGEILMELNLEKLTEKIGMPPGSLVHVGKRKMQASEINLIRFDAKGFKEEKFNNVEDLAGKINFENVFWLNLNGLHDISLLKKIGELFQIHPLILEDILNTHKLPQIKWYDKQLFIVIKVLRVDEKKGDLVSDQISLILGENFLLTFQEHPHGEVFESIRNHLRDSKGIIRNQGVDFLAYALIDSIVDNYFLVLSKFSEKIDRIEEGLVYRFDKSKLKSLHALRRQIILFRRFLWPVREAISEIIRKDISLIAGSTRIYFQDVYEHTVHILEMVEYFRESLGGILDIYLSNLNNRTNEIMKVLTIMAALFLPITFLVGVYGMNFKFMPELDWHWSYPVIWLVIIGIVSGMIVFFKRRKWI